MMQTFTKCNLLRQKKNTYVCFDPVWRYFRLSILSYFAAAERSDQWFRQTALKPGRIVTHRRAVSTSWETPSLDRDSMHFSLSWQQKQSPAFCKCSSEQLPHLHLYKNIKTVVSRGIIDSQHRSVDRKAIQ